MISRNNLSCLRMRLCASPQNPLSIGPFPRLGDQVSPVEKPYFLKFLLPHLQFVFSLAPKGSSSLSCSLYSVLRIQFVYSGLDIMAPLLATLIPRDSRFNPATTSNEFRDQYIHPGDIFSVLLILGGDVVARALAQLADGGLTPFTFSFGTAPLYPIPTLAIC